MCYLNVFYISNQSRYLFYNISCFVTADFWVHPDFFILRTVDRISNPDNFENMFHSMTDIIFKSMGYNVRHGPVSLVPNTAFIINP